MSRRAALLDALLLQRPPWAFQLSYEGADSPGQGQVGHEMETRCGRWGYISMCYFSSPWYTSMRLTTRLRLLGHFLGMIYREVFPCHECISSSGDGNWVHGQGG